MEYFLVGRIVGTHGINGEVKVINESDFERFTVGNTLYVSKENKYKKIIIDTVRPHKGMLLVSFNKITNINDVLEYVNTSVYIKGHESLGEGRFYFDDLIGLEVISNNEKIGLVNDIIELPNQNLLEIKQNNGKVSLVPYVDEFIKEVNIEEKTITINSIEGLL